MYIKAIAAQQGCKTRTVACLKINDQLNVKNSGKLNRVDRVFKTTQRTKIYYILV